MSITNPETSIWECEECHDFFIGDKESVAHMSYCDTKWFDLLVI